MDVLMVAAELTPYARSTETADAVPCLAKALRQLGHRVTIALPRYGGFEAEGLLVARRLTPLLVGSSEVTVFDGQLSSGVEIVLFDLPGQGDREDVYADPQGPGAPEELERFSWLARAAVALAEKRREQGKGFDVIHGHDWPGGLVGAFRGEGAPPLVLTVHDARRAGFFDRALIAELAPDLALGERPCALAVGLLRADAVTSVSPSYARSLAEPGQPLAEAFGALPESVLGIENALDYAVYNPATDSALEARYDAEDPWGKARTKGAILRQLRLELDIQKPLAIVPGALAHDRGSDLVVSALPALLKNDLAVIVAGRGDEAFANAFRALREQRPEAFAFMEVDDEETLRRLHAAADIVIVPARHAPSAFAAQLAQRYGALPVAHATGGLSDAVVDCDPALETGTGFLFDEPDPGALLAAAERALAAYASEAGWARLRRRVMRLDLGWDRPTRRYAQVYRRVAEGEKS